MLLFSVERDWVPLMVFRRVLPTQSDYSHRMICTLAKDIMDRQENGPLYGSININSELIKATSSTTSPKHYFYAIYLTLGLFFSTCTAVAVGFLRRYGRYT